MGPVRITMETSAPSASPHSDGDIPSCSYYDEGAGGWDVAGLATESVTVFPSGDSDQGGAVNLTCLSFHLSDFTVSSDVVHAAFTPVSLVRDNDFPLANRMMAAARNYVVYLAKCMYIHARSAAV